MSAMANDSRVFAMASLLRPAARSARAVRICCCPDREWLVRLRNCCSTSMGVSGS